MLVSHTHKFIFLKTRKTAGTSLEMLFQPFCTPSGHLVTERCEGLNTSFGIVGHRLLDAASNAADAVRKFRAHLPADKIKEVLTKDQWNNYFWFTAVRNPFSRCVSGYYCEKAAYKLGIPENFAALKRDFVSYLKSPSFQNDENVTHREGEFIIQDAIRFETIHDDISRIAKKIGVEKDLAELPVTKRLASRETRRPTADYYLDEARELVLTQMKWVFEHYDYSTNPRDA
ncbi:sulfotransferase family 2 domain-containing protein [Planktotalea sp.]|uniref:sulfotransferase family 2 domain-containing protein n=1 Tax=Planktotalea sp. TaxID=2029877 RepID=UPI003297B98A